jgi:hypothetical protein
MTLAYILVLSLLYFITAVVGHQDEDVHRSVSMYIDSAEIASLGAIPISLILLIIFCRCYAKPAIREQLN